MGLWSLERVQQGAGVGADVVVLVDGLVQIYGLAVDADVHAAAVGRRHQRGHQRNVCKRQNSTPSKSKGLHLTVERFCQRATLTRKAADKGAGLGQEVSWNLCVLGTPRPPVHQQQGLVS